MYDLYLQIWGSILAVLGALCNCSPVNEDKLLGFGLWICSNAILGVWAFWTGNWWVMGMYVVFELTSARGFWSHRRIE